MSNFQRYSDNEIKEESYWICDCCEPRSFYDDWLENATDYDGVTCDVCGISSQDDEEDGEDEEDEEEKEQIS